jgi:hypothetical protein
VPEHVGVLPAPQAKKNQHEVPWDIDWKCTVRRGVFCPPEAQHNGWTAFHVACAYGKLSAGKCAQLMVEAGCDVDVATKVRAAALPVAKLLCRSPHAAVPHRDQFGRTGWQLAQMNKQRKVIEYLEGCASAGMVDVNGPAAGTGRRIAADLTVG